MAKKTELILYDKMVAAIDACHRVDEVKEIRDKAAALELYCRQAKDYENERKAARIRIRAERKAGELLAELERGKGYPGGASQPRSEYRRAYEEAGASHYQARRWQDLAAVPEKYFEEALASRDFSTDGILREHAKKKPREQPKPETKRERPKPEVYRFLHRRLKQLVEVTGYVGELVEERDVLDAADWWWEDTWAEFRSECVKLHKALGALLAERPVKLRVVNEETVRASGLPMPRAEAKKGNSNGKH
jgi:hypothetical protein